MHAQFNDKNTLSKISILKNSCKDVDIINLIRAKTWISGKTSILNLFFPQKLHYTNHIEQKTTRHAINQFNFITKFYTSKLLIIRKQLVDLLVIIPKYSHR
jgi:hypothetical protein